MQFGKTTLALLAAFVAQSAANSIYDLAANTDGFATLAAAVDAAGLTDVLSGEGTFTVFAPPDDAFAALPDGAVDKLLEPEWVHHLQDVLLYHTLGSEVKSTDLSDGLETATLNGEDIVINLEPARINDASTILVEDGLVDIPTDNGVVHAVDAVLLPTSVTSTIVDIAAGNPDFSTLVAAVQAADLVDALSGEGPLTVFAPTDEAFAALPEGTLETLLLPENKQMLTDILTYHVVGANAHSSALAPGPVETLNGATVEVTTGEGVMVNDANVVAADILANNGIIHVIDKVILPPTEEEEMPAMKEKEEMPEAMDDTSSAAGNVLGIGAVAAGLTAMFF
mmetsp:Transcript_688/g.1452  ORF Transcript_688/g.1452 Transcript_688/m.1452 type:complete len:339 (-) Transcript_688:71-1087(-)|eukprot:CAMPEP_0178502034 /NCGR_PEP_ID=MMETSP0696-20121128/17288_1 /TAXON_ID=265572 /ORGANISM="Extubocellulus spinifer, Strain CCMP396" /LENGTH=338 /DNA_ID=CAMNT_0020131063 /DNA_START=78 /DNA_END=1094 /DNA_ORIENTATION=+